ncbi:MAG: rhomboid family intramembrane serine protease, partial [Promethearchaeota archaeon]
MYSQNGLKIGKITLILSLINVFVFVLSSGNDKITLLFSQVNVLVLNGEIYRLFTSMFVHASIIHLASNMIFLIMFGSILENQEDGGWKHVLIL